MIRFLPVLLLLAWPAHADGIQAHARVLEVTDGDTMKVEAYPWPGDIKRVVVRLANTDTTELDATRMEERRDDPY